jgi:hypothetical protein
MNLPSRALAIGVFRFSLVSSLAVVVLFSTVIFVAYCAAWMHDAEWTNSQYLSIGLVCAFVFWLFAAVFHLRRETHTMTFTQREQFIAKAKTVLVEMGYAMVAQRAGVLILRPRFHSYLFGGSIHISFEEREAKVTGPKVALEIFRRGFRLLNHVQRVQLHLQEHRKFTDNVIKRVELRLRLNPDQLQAVRKNVIDVLSKEADIVCELNLLVQSEKGMREDMLEFQIRQWLQQQGIDCEIHKDLVQFVEVVHPELEPTAQ